jgi:hypothetical protein
MNDFLEAFAWVALLSYTFNVLVSFASGRPMVEWINPGRHYLPGLAGTLLLTGYGLLTRARWKHQTSYTDLLQRLISEERAVPEVVVGLGLAFFAVAVLLLYVWCWWFLPRDPRTFSSNPKNLTKEYARALRHYVRWKGGLDFAAVMELKGGVLVPIAQAVDPKDVLRGLMRIPRGEPHVSAGKEMEAVTAQTATWLALANQLWAKWEEFHATLAPVGQGHCVATCFDVAFGAMFLRVVEEPLNGRRPTPGASPENPPAEPPHGGVFLFAAALNQHEVNTMTAATHYTLLYRALHHIREGIVSR